MVVGRIGVDEVEEVGGFLVVEEEHLNVLDGAHLLLCLAVAASRFSCARLFLSRFLFSLLLC